MRRPLQKYVSLTTAMQRKALKSHKNDLEAERRLTRMERNEKNLGEVDLNHMFIYNTGVDFYLWDFFRGREGKRSNTYSHVGMEVWEL